jgi:hypothetical protein
MSQVPRTRLLVPPQGVAYKPAIPRPSSTERSDAAMTVTIPLVAIAGILVYLTYRYMGLRMWHAIVALIFGFLLAATSAAPPIQQFLSNLAQWLNKP